MKTLLLQLSLFMFSVAITGKLIAQPIIQWDRTIGGDAYDGLGAVARTPDGGYIIGGTSTSNVSGEKSENSDNYNFWIVKTNASGVKQWDKTIDGAYIETDLKNILLTDDGGYLLGGSEHNDFGLVIKLDKNGVIQWEKKYLRGTTSTLESLQKVPGGGYIIGLTFQGNESQSQGPIRSYDYWVIKIDINGATQWEKVYGGAGSDQLGSVQPTSDNGYIVAGSSNSGKGGDKSEAAKGYGDFWILKLNASGNKQWDKTIGGPGGEGDAQISQTPDKGYILGGVTSGAAGGDKSENSTGVDYWVVKLSATGQVQWDQTLSGGANPEGRHDELLTALIQTADGGYLAGGFSDSPAGVDKSEEPMDYESIDMWIVKLAADGSKEWDKTIATSEWDFINSIVQSSDGGYLLAGTTTAGVSGDKTQESRGDSDYWIVKLAPENVPSPQTLIRINAGGPDFTTATKKLFMADKYYNGLEGTTSIPSGDILNTTNDVLYRSARSAPYFNYAIPVENIQVNVTLHFAETYFGAPGRSGGAGSRRFHVDIEGSRKLTNYDIFAAAGGAMRAVQITIPVTVADGVLNISFSTGAADLPRICAIEVVATNFAIFPVADAYVRDGSFSTTNFNGVPSLDIKTVSNDPSVNRTSYLRFKVPQELTIAAAKLRIYGRNHENTKSVSVHAYGVNNDSWTEGGIVKANAPAASTGSLGYVSVNNVYKYYEIDVTSYVKAQQQSGDELVSLLLRDPNNRNTRLVFNSKEAISKPPQLIIQNITNSTARLAQDESPDEQQEKELSTVFPNPATNEFTVSISMQHAGDISFKLVNNEGKSHLIQAAGRARPGEKARLDIGNLPHKAGVYLLKIESKSFTEVVKMLITE